MRELGVSIYPGHASEKEYKEYLMGASQAGFTRVFTCLLSAGEKNGEKLVAFKRICEYAGTLGMEVIADVSPAVFQEHKLSIEDLKFFSELNLKGIRLDLGFSGNEESLMSYNPYNLKIELNMSGGTRYLDTILSYCPNKKNLYGCHNFYPHRYTGLSREHFFNTSRYFKERGIKTAAFISSQNASFGPWPIHEGLCTLEEHRNLPIEVQAKDLFNTDLIDVVIIGNCFPNRNELTALSHLDKDILTLKVELIDQLPEVEKKIILEELHFNRGDVSSFMIRSTQSRLRYEGHEFKLFNPQPIKRGDLLMESSLYGRYAGEVQIALKNMENSGRTSVIGRVAPEEMFLADTLRPWQKFRFALLS